MISPPSRPQQWSGNKIRPPKSDTIAAFSDSIPDCGNDLATVFMIHKRELSDSMIESGSSLFYLFHCSAHDRLNTMPFRLFRNTPHGLHQQNRTDAMPQIHAICCELVDSFSDATKAASALTIFPRFSTVKAIYIAIIDSLGRTIDRFFGANRTEKIY